MPDLPVLEIQAELCAAASQSEFARFLLKAPTGSGKSTAVPSFLLGEVVKEGVILVVEPRRMAARLLAEHVASLRGGQVGAEVGYTVRFDRKVSDASRLIYLTDGVLQRRLQSDPELKGVAMVIFDEFHERRLSSDLSLARLLEVQETLRPDLKLGVMSATLELEGLERYLEPCTVLEAGGRLYPVDIQYLGQGAASRPARRGTPPAPEPIWERVGKLCRKLSPSLGEGERILIFLPGEFEIRKTVDLLSSSSAAKGCDVFPLYSSLPPGKQREAIAKGSRPKVIVSTNVAETSITIEGVVHVIDSGLARVAHFDARRGMNTLTIQKISQAAADQRAGRAGRTGPGTCWRLWSDNDHARRPAFETPEVRRIDLTEAALYLKKCGVLDVQSFRWLTAPLDTDLEKALSLLKWLGATEKDGSLTTLGQTLAVFPLHPRAARLLIAGEEGDCAAECLFAAAALQGESVFLKKKGPVGRTGFTERRDASDFEADFRAATAAREMKFDPRSCGQLGILGRAARELWKTCEQFETLAEKQGIYPGECDFEAKREPFARAMLAAYGDQAAVRLGEATLACRVLGGRRGKLDENSCVRRSSLFLATEMTEVEGRELTVYLNRAVSIEIEWLKETFPEQWHQKQGASYDEQLRRVVNLDQTLFGDLVLEKKEGGTPDLAQAAALLGEQVSRKTLVLNGWDKTVESWINRVNWVATKFPDYEMPLIDDEALLTIFTEISYGSVSYKEIKNKEVWPVLDAFLSQVQKETLKTYAPKQLLLENGRETKVRYKPEATISLRVQELFGVKETPTLMGGHPIKIEILGPNQRPWQLTADLASFWETGYPQMKKDLAGRYPKHHWPDHPPQKS